MLNRLYVVKLQPINIFNLPLALMLKTIGSEGYNTSDCLVSDTGEIKFTSGEFARSYTAEPDKEFRTIDWSVVADQLVTQVNDAELQNKSIVFGTYRQDQINYLKLKFKGTITTIGTSYSDKLYNYLLKLMAKKHVDLIRTGQVELNKTDDLNLNTLTTDELIEYYTGSSNIQQLIPQTNCDHCDYIIPLEDFNNERLVIQHFSNFKITLTNDALNFYRKWNSFNNIGE